MLSHWCNCLLEMSTADMIIARLQDIARCILHQSFLFISAYSTLPVPLISMSYSLDTFVMYSSDTQDDYQDFELRDLFACAVQVLYLRSLLERVVLLGAIAGL